MADRIRVEFSAAPGSMTSSRPTPPSHRRSSRALRQLQGAGRRPPPEQKQTIVTRVTDLYADLYGDRARANTMVLVDEVPDGWGIGGGVLTLADLTEDQT